MNLASAPFLADAPAPIARPQRTRLDALAAPGSWPVAILGVPFDHVTLAGALARIEDMIASRRPHYIVTANVDFLVQAHRDVELRRILLEADLTLCDGTPLVWASRLLGNALPERVAGSDLVPELMHVAAEKGHRIFFLGAAPGVAERATAKLQAQYPGIHIVGHYAPPFAALLDMDHAQIAERIRAAQPDILLVGFGCPKQEKWIAMHHRTLGVPVAIGVGATIDFLAGRVKRAPEWMRRSGTEWLYRLLQEPRRLFRRYANDLVCFAPTFMAQSLRLASPRRPARSPALGASPVPGWLAVNASDTLTRRSLIEHGRFWRDVRQRDTHCLLDCAALRNVDATGVAFLVHWRKALRARDRHLLLVAPTPALQRALASLRLEDHFAIAADAADATQQAEALTAARPVLEDGETRSLAWCGEIVAANANDVWRTTTEHVRAFADAGATLVIVDLARLRFIDSSGAAIMLRLKKWAQELHAQILFTRPQENVRNVLRITRLEQLLLEGGQ